MFNHGKCVVHGKRGLVEACYSFSDNAIEGVVHGCDVLNKGASLALTSHPSYLECHQL